MTRITTLLAATLLATTPALADMEDYDGDSDGMLSDVEFGEADGMRRFLDYDTDESGDVSEEEFAAGEFRRYDADRDGMVNDEEYARYEEDADGMEEED